MLLLTVNMAFTFPMSVFGSYISSQEKFFYLKLINLATSVFSPALNIILLLSGFGSIGLISVTSGISIIVYTINVIYSLKVLKMKFNFHNKDFSLLRDIFLFSFFIAINSLIDQINWSTDKIILSKIVNGGAVAIYSVGASLNSMFSSFSTSISGVFATKVNKIVASKDPNMDKELTDLMIRVGRVQWFLLYCSFVNGTCGDTFNPKCWT